MTDKTKRPRGTVIKTLTTSAVLTALLATGAGAQGWKEDYQIVMFGIMSGKNKQDRIQRYTALETYLETSWASTSRSSRLLKRRFTQVQGEVLRAIAWWDWSHERLRETLPDIHALLEKHGT